MTDDRPSLLPPLRHRLAWRRPPWQPLAAIGVGLAVLLATQATLGHLWQERREAALSDEASRITWAIGERLQRWKVRFDLMVDTALVRTDIPFDRVTAEAMRLARTTGGIVETSFADGAIVRRYPRHAPPPAFRETVSPPENTTALEAGGEPPQLLFVRATSDAAGRRVMARMWVPAAAVEVPDASAYRITLLGAGGKPVPLSGVRGAAAGAAQAAVPEEVIVRQPLPAIAGWTVAVSANGMTWPGLASALPFMAATAAGLTTLLALRRRRPQDALLRVAEARHDLRNLVLATRIRAADIDPAASRDRLADAREAIGAGLEAILGIIDRGADEDARITRRVAPEAFLRSILAIHAPVAAAAGQELRLVAEAPLPEVVLDGDRLIRVMTNLLANAARHAPGGAVDIRLSLGNAKDARPVLRIDIADRGPGLTNAERLRLAAGARVPTSKDGEGEGLGLGIVRRLVAEMDGRMALGERLGGGTAFQLRIPVEIATAAASNTPSLSGLHILVVDDSAPLRKWTIEVLRKAGAEAEAAAGGAEALGIARARRFHIAVLDMRLGDMSGTDLARQLARLSFPPALVAFSGHLDTGIEAECHRAGIDLVLTKSMDPVPLLNALGSLRATPGQSAREGPRGR